MIASGLLEADSVAVYVPLTGLEVDFAVGDILVKGKVTDEVDGSTFTVTDLINAYPSVVRVKSVDRYDYGSAALQHIRLGAS